MSAEPCARLSIAELRKFDLFSGDDDTALGWLSERFEVICYAEGEIIINEGDIADRFLFLLEGEMQFSRPSDPSIGVFVVGPGEPTGVLPFSRMKIFAGRAMASQPTRLAAMRASHLQELVFRAPNLAQKLVWEMTDRAREFTQNIERNSKMLALGKLSAGLAHELNNPASAVVRSSTKLRELLLKRRDDAVNLRAQFFPETVQNTLADLTRISAAAALDPPSLDELERSDLEADLADWLERNGLSGDKAGDLVLAGINAEILAPLAEIYDGPKLDKILTLLLADHQMLALISEVEEAARRMSELVQAVKSYSYMDTSPVVEVDIEDGIKTTLRMFQHQLKHGYTVKKHFVQNLPKIHANGSELNQIWTNLIDNAIDAMDGVDSEEKVLEIRTANEMRCILVEFSDSGKGIPPEVQGRIFEPFFTTKPIGKGTGLGLDIVQRIVRSHKGSIQVDSKPGRTTFRIRLPK